MGAEGLSFVGSEGERAGAPGWNGALVGAPNFAFMLMCVIPVEMPSRLMGTIVFFIGKLSKLFWESFSTGAAQQTYRAPLSRHQAKTIPAKITNKHNQLGISENVVTFSTV